MNTTLDPQGLAQFGFAAVSCWMMWALIKELIPKMLTTIDRNTASNVEASAALREVVGGQRDVIEGQHDQAAKIGRMDDRLLILEKQHEYGVRECPVADGRDGGRRKSDRIVVSNDGRESAT